MGFFKKLFPAPRPPPFVPTEFPFTGEIRMYHSEYDRIATGWWRVSINSPDEWSVKTAEMAEGLRRHFGIFVAKDGSALPRWNDKTWTRVRQGLVVERR